MARSKILVVDDDTAMREMMALALGKEGFNVHPAASADEARQAVDSTNFDLIVTDIYLGDGTGLELLEHCHEACPEAKVILVTAHGTIETAASARRLGVFDYLAKPFEVDALVKRVRAALHRPSNRVAEVELGPESLIIGNDPAFVEVYNAIARVAPLPIPVLVRGETGTGKELIVRAIHGSSLRKDRPLLKINCATLPLYLIESELFGHERGAFTGAFDRRVGRFEAANGATLFLDEIGELPLELQPKLLRVIQDGEFERLGSFRTIKVDVRIIAATNRDLEEEVRNDRFRKDLWYRLNIFPITVPPLREHLKDIPQLVEYYVDKISRRLGKSIESIPTNVMNTLRNYHWPGNVRELENVIERTLINSSGPTLRMTDELKMLDKDLTTTPKTLAKVERDHIVRVLEQTRWKVSGKNGASEILGLNVSTLRARMRKQGIRRP